MKPLGFDRRHEDSTRGRLAMWWYRRRVRKIRDAQMRQALDRYAAEHPVRHRP